LISEEGLSYFGSIGNFINYIDVKTGLFNEVEMYEPSQDYTIRPFLPSATYDQLTSREKALLPKIIQGVSSEKYVALLFQDGSERYIRIYFRFLQKNFELFFEMNNELNNMKNLAQIDTEEKWSILSMDTIKDGDNFYSFIVTSKTGLLITINQVRMPQSL
jgi:hypothetical protein